MADVILENTEFIVKRTKRDYVLIRKGLGYDYHSHFKRLGGAKKIITMFNKGLLPTKPYFVTAMRRVTTDEEYSNLFVKRKKDLYYNLQK